MTASWLILVPCLNERKNLPELVTHLQQVFAQADRLFVDGGSQDGSQDLLNNLGEKVIACAPGRGLQVDTGIRTSQHDNILILHADCRWPALTSPLAAMEQLLARPGVVVGAFGYAVDSAVPHYRAMERLVNWRSRRLSLPFGDQGLFFKRESYLQTGGVAHCPIFDDVELLGRLKKQGRVELLDQWILSSPRRYESRGFYRSCFLNMALMVLHTCRVPPRTLQRFYV